MQAQAGTEPAAGPRSGSGSGLGQATTARPPHTLPQASAHYLSVLTREGENIVKRLGVTKCQSTTAWHELPLVRVRTLPHIAGPRAGRATAELVVLPGRSDHLESRGIINCWSGLKIQHMGVPHLPRQPVFVISDFPTIITVYYIHHLVDEYECNAMK